MPDLVVYAGSHPDVLSDSDTRHIDPTVREPIKLSASYAVLEEEGADA